METLFGSIIWVHSKYGDFFGPLVKKVTFFAVSWAFVSFSWKKCFFSSFPWKNTKKVIFLVIFMKKVLFFVISWVFVSFSQKRVKKVTFSGFFFESGNKRRPFPRNFPEMASKKPKSEKPTKSGFLWRNGFHKGNSIRNQWSLFSGKSVWSNFLKKS